MTAKSVLMAGFLATGTVLMSGVSAHAHEPDPSGKWVEVTSPTGLNHRQGPSTKYSAVSVVARPLVVQRLSHGDRAKVSERVHTDNPADCDRGDCWWLKIDLGGGDYGFISEQYTKPLDPPRDLKDYTCPEGEQICIAVDLADQSLFLVFDGEVLFSTWISSGRARTPTPEGVFRVYREDALHNMKGTVATVGSDYLLPKVPHTMYFKGLYTLHGTYWHFRYGTVPQSHGCVNMAPLDAKFLYEEVGVGALVHIAPSLPHQ